MQEIVIFTAAELFLFLQGIFDYEEGIYHIIKELVRFKPNTKEELEIAVREYSENKIQTIYGPIEIWNTSLITDMSSLFSGCTLFNSCIDRWDVSNVTDMTEMFWGMRIF